MSDLSTATQAAEPYTVEGVEYKFPVLEMTPDIGNICKDLKKKKQDEVAAYCTMNMVPFEQKMAAFSNVKDVTYPEFANFAESPEGINRVLVESLKKASMKPDEARTLVNKIPSGDRYLLARLVSGIAVRVPADPTPGTGAAST
jgi:hypothetical protein